MNKQIRFLFPALILLGIFFVIPTISLLLRSVLEPELGIGNYITLLGGDTYHRVFYNTFFVSFIVTFLSILIGFPIAWFLAIMPKKWGNVVLAIIILSMWTNLLARTYAWMVLLQKTGVINKLLLSIGIIQEPLSMVNNLTGVVIGMTYIMLPFFIIPLQGAIKNIDPMLLQASALCGANRIQSFFKVLLPLTKPAIMAGGLMVFVMSLGYFVTPALLGGTSNMMIAEMISQLVQTLLDWGMGSAMAFVLLFITLALYALQLRYNNHDRNY